MTGNVEVASLDGSILWGLEVDPDSGNVTVYRRAEFELGSGALLPDGMVCLPLPVLSALVLAVQALR
jgi:hypothetical protein